MKHSIIAFTIFVLCCTASADFISDLLQVHNNLRDVYNIPHLSWSSDLAATATQWAQNIASNGDLSHSKQKGRGENVAYRTSGAGSAVKMAQGWGNERQNFIPGGKYPDVSKGGKVGHYTQMIWSESTKVGCGLATEDGRDYLVCQYTPAGNIYGHYVYTSSSSSSSSSTDFLPNPETDTNTDDNVTNEQTDDTQDNTDMQDDSQDGYKDNVQDESEDDYRDDSNDDSTNDSNSNDSRDNSNYSRDNSNNDSRDNSNNDSRDNSNNDSRDNSNNGYRDNYSDSQSRRRRHHKYESDDSDNNNNMNNAQSDSRNGYSDSRNRSRNRSHHGDYNRSSSDNNDNKNYWRYNKNSQSDNEMLDGASPSRSDDGGSFRRRRH